MQFFSQVGQDRFIFERFFEGKRNGTFVDIGAYDGTTFNNTLFLERYLGWTGICIEPLPSIFPQLVKSRTARCLNCCVSDHEGTADFLDVEVAADAQMLSGLVENYDPRHLERIERQALRKSVRQVPVKSLSSILRENQLFAVDYCSIDTEGSELKILQGLDFSQFSIELLSVESNSGDPRIKGLLEDQGYELFATFEGFDQLYKKKTLQPLPRTTVICSVWHGDAARFDLAAGHAANLDAQTRPVKRIYVFDGGDPPPTDLNGLVLACRDNLTLYEAWNAALALVRTPYVMNLNLDDRLAPDAVALLENALDLGADLAGGDWRICFSQAETDAVGPSQPAEVLPCVAAWPPPRGAAVRLGSGNANSQATFGPACLWRMSLHQALARFPFQFGDGTLIRAIGDGVWWRLLSQNNKKTQRVPRIIGNYHSHPSDQAEFRYPSQEEESLLQKFGIRL